MSVPPSARPRDGRSASTGRDRRRGAGRSVRGGLPAAGPSRRRGRDVRAAAHAVGPGAQRRGPRPPGDQGPRGTFERETLGSGGCSFLGTSRSASTSRTESFATLHHAVIYAAGAQTASRSDMPGEDLPGSHAATEFVAWYNGHPDYSDRDFDLSASRAVVVGNGNVALDVARMLVLDPEEVAATDTADHAVEGLARAHVEHVVVLGRRGPAQAAFTNPELLELGELEAATQSSIPRRSSWTSTRAPGSSSPGRRWPRRRSRSSASTRSAHRPASRTASSFASSVHRSRCSGTVRTLRSSGLRVVRNRIEPDERGNLRAVVDRRRGSDRVRPRSAVDRVPRTRAARRSVRRAPWRDP